MICGNLPFDIKKIYGMCCLINNDPKSFSTEVIPTVSRIGQIDMDKTITNAESVYGMEPSFAKPIVHFILWRVERTSRLFSEFLRHNPREGRELRRPVQINLDGSCELYEALRIITHTRNFLGNIPGAFLMTLLPSFGKSRSETAFVFPKFDGTYKERQAKNEIVPRNRWIDSITSKAAFHALRPDGESFFNDVDMELYVRCNSGHPRYVDLEAMGRPLWKYQNTWEEPSYDLPNASKHCDQDHEEESTSAPKSIEQDRKIVPSRKKAVTFLFHATYGTQIGNILQQGVKPGRTHTPRGRQHVHMARIDDIIYDDQESAAALTHVPKGRDALLILAFARDNQHNIRITEELPCQNTPSIHAALSQHSIPMGSPC